MNERLERERRLSRAAAEYLRTKQQDQWAHRDARVNLKKAASDLADAMLDQENDR